MAYALAGLAGAGSIPGWVQFEPVRFRPAWVGSVPSGCLKHSLGQLGLIRFGLIRFAFSKVQCNFALESLNLRIAQHRI